MTGSKIAAVSMLALLMAAPATSQNRNVLISPSPSHELTTVPDVVASPSMVGLGRLFPDAPEARLEALRERISSRPSAVIGPQEVNAVIQTVLADMSLTANSCLKHEDFPWEVRFGTPEVVHASKPLEVWTLTLDPQERAATEFDTTSGIPDIGLGVAGRVRTRDLRICVHRWVLDQWQGDIVNGKVVVRATGRSEQLSNVPGAIEQVNPLIKTERRFQTKVDVFPEFVPDELVDALDLDEWDDYEAVDWGHPVADISVRDLLNGAPLMTVTLAPDLCEGALCYRFEGVTWNSNSGFVNPVEETTGDLLDLGLFEQLPDLARTIEAYNDAMIDTRIRPLVSDVFEGATMRDALGTALDMALRTDLPDAGAIAIMMPAGREVRVTFVQ